MSDRNLIQARQQRADEINRHLASGFRRVVVFGRTPGGTRISAARVDAGVLQGCLWEYRNIEQQMVAAGIGDFLPTGHYGGGWFDIEDGTRIELL